MDRGYLGSEVASFLEEAFQEGLVVSEDLLILSHPLSHLFNF